MKKNLGYVFLTVWLLVFTSSCQPLSCPPNPFSLISGRGSFATKSSSDALTSEVWKTSEGNKCSFKPLAGNAGAGETGTWHGVVKNTSGQLMMLVSKIPDINSEEELIGWIDCGNITNIEDIESIPDPEQQVLLHECESQ